MKFLHILKTQGTDRIPDYIQVRDENFVLLTHSRADKPQNALKSVGLGNYCDRIIELVAKMPYGEMKKLELDEE